MNPYWYIIKMVTLYFYFLSFLFHVFLLLPGSHATFSGHVSLGSSWLWQASQTFLVSDDHDSLEEAWSGILYNVPPLRFVVRLGLWVFGRKTPEERCHSYIISRVYIRSTWHLTADVDLEHPDEAMLIRFFHWKVTLFPLLPYCTFWKGSH